MVSNTYTTTTLTTTVITSGAIVAVTKLAVQPRKEPYLLFLKIALLLTKTRVEQVILTFRHHHSML